MSSSPSSFLRRSTTLSSGGLAGPGSCRASASRSAVAAEPIILPSPWRADCIRRAGNSNLFVRLPGPPAVLGRFQHLGIETPRILRLADGEKGHGSRDEQLQQPVPL